MTRFALLAAVALVAIFLYPSALRARQAVPVTKEQRLPNTLSEAERAAGWRLLFDGRTTDGWRGFRRDAMPDGWQVRDGTLARVAQAGDIITTEQFSSFELTLEWKVAAGGNSGIFFHVTENADYVWQTGPEMQILDNAGHRDGLQPETSTGSNYALHAPSRDVARPAGEWNAVRLIVRGDHVEHWLNGEKIVEYELGSDDWEARVAASKFGEMPGYGRNRRGHIALQDHGDPVEFRSIRIRLAADEDFWREIRHAFTIDRTLINLNNGGVSPSPRVVQEAMARYLAFSNEAPVYTMWQVLEPQLESVRRQLAADFGCDPKSSRSPATRPRRSRSCSSAWTCEPGDEVLTTNQDYPRMLTTWEQRVRRDGIVLKASPSPCRRRTAVPRGHVRAGHRAAHTRAALLSHHEPDRPDLPDPRDRAHGARRGVEVIVDGAHAYAQFPFTHADLDCDYYGTSLHKWLLAPHGTGFLYVRREKDRTAVAAHGRAAVDGPRHPQVRGDRHAPRGEPQRHRRSAVVPPRHRRGTEGGAAGLLRERWMTRLQDHPAIRIYTARERASPAPSAPSASTASSPAPSSSTCGSAHRIIVTPIMHDEYRGIRVTPNVYTTLTEVDAFAAGQRGDAAAGARSLAAAGGDHRQPRCRNRAGQRPDGTAAAVHAARRLRLRAGRAHH
jgi:isopenicillin-N epimerase